MDIAKYYVTILLIENASGLNTGSKILKKLKETDLSEFLTDNINRKIHYILKTCCDIATSTENYLKHGDNESRYKRRG